MTAKAFRWGLPEGATDRVKSAVDLDRTELISIGVQIINGGGETNLHAHNGEDAVWIVLNGRAAFYDEDDRRIELGQHEVIMLPSGTKYWFESVGDEPLEIARIGAKDPRVAQTRTDVTERERVARVGATPHFPAEVIEPQPVAV
jgi:mannose-6-phosphate isomerase-like protein (cupin superfamily)